MEKDGRSSSSILQNMGVGGFLFNDKTGPINRMGLQLAYAYHLRTGAKSYLSFGVGGMMYQHVLDKSLITLDELDDNAMLGDKTRKFMADAVFGMKYTFEGFYFGFSAPQLIQSELKINDNNLNKLVRHYFVNTGYKININEDFGIEPSILFKAISAAPIQLDGNLKFIYKDMLWLGTSFRNGDAAVVMLGVKKSGFQFGYSYDATLSEIKKYSSGTHEIVLGLLITDMEKTLKKINNSKAKY
jgi:type IX secretion system PorP/SprF family membrane protein